MEINPATVVSSGTVNLNHRVGTVLGKTDRLWVPS